MPSVRAKEERKKGTSRTSYGTACTVSCMGERISWRSHQIARLAHAYVHRNVIAYVMRVVALGKAHRERKKERERESPGITKTKL